MNIEYWKKLFVQLIIKFGNTNSLHFYPWKDITKILYLLFCIFSREHSPEVNLLEFHQIPYPKLKTAYHRTNPFLNFFNIQIVLKCFWRVVQPVVPISHKERSIDWPFHIFVCINIGKVGREYIILMLLWNIWTIDLHTVLTNYFVSFRKFSAISREDNDDSTHHHHHHHHHHRGGHSHNHGNKVPYNGYNSEEYLDRLEPNGNIPSDKNNCRYGGK